MGFLPEEMGVFVGLTIWEKSPGHRRHPALAVAKLAGLLGCVGEFGFELKKLLNGKKTERLLRVRLQNEGKRPSSQKTFCGAIRSFSLELNGSLPMPIRLYFAKISYIRYMTLDFPARPCPRVRCHFTCRKIAEC